MNMQLQDILYSQGFGIRRVCSGLVQQGWVELWDTEDNDWVRCLDSTQDIDPEGLRYRVQGVEWAYHALGYVLLHKPAGTECSQKPSTYPSIYSLLPLPLRLRPNKGDRKSTRLNSSHQIISYAVFCLKKKTTLLLNKNARLMYQVHIFCC